MDASIFTTLDGMALDTFRVQDERAAAFDDERRLGRLRETVARTVAGRLDLDREVARRRRSWMRGPRLAVTPRVLIDNNASTRHTLVEINARDRPGLLFDLARTIADLDLVIVTARVATYGERAVDAFYVRDRFGLKIESASRLAGLRERLLAAIDETGTAAFAGAAG